MNAIAIPTRPFGSTPSSADRGRRISSNTSSSATMIERIAEPPWAASARHELERLVSLPHGWDGYDAEPLSRSAAQDALNFLEASLGQVTESPAMTPIHGGVQLEWHRGPLDIEVEVRSGAWNAFIRDGSSEWEGDVRAEPGALTAGLQRLIELQGA